MKRNNGQLIFGRLLAVVGLEVLLHWYLASHMNSTLTRLYLSSSKKSSITALVDNYLPAIIVAVPNARSGGFGQMEEPSFPPLSCL